MKTVKGREFDCLEVNTMVKSRLNLKGSSSSKSSYE
jgi:hypothetical protein